MRLLIPLKTITPYFSYFAEILNRTNVPALIIATREAMTEGTKMFPKFDWIEQSKNVSGYPEIIIGEIIASQNSDWFLRLDSDEWMSPEAIQKISTHTQLLEKSVVYGFERRWIGINPNNGKIAYREYGRMFWKKPSVHETSVILHDQNYRLFHSDYVYPSKTLHGVGVLGGNYGSIQQFGPIYHLDWLLQPKNKARIQSSQLSKFSITNFSVFDDIYQCCNSEDASEWKEDVNLDNLEEFIKTIKDEENK